MADPLQPADHARAQEAFATVLKELDDAQLSAPTPCAGWTVTDVLLHVIGGNRRMGQVEPLAGPPTTADEARAQHAESAAAAQAVFDSDGVLERTFTLPGIGDLPGHIVVQLRTTDALTHAWDVAVASGQGTDIEPALAAAVLDRARALVRPELRGDGRPFAAEQKPPAGATNADQLAAFLGRTKS